MFLLRSFRTPATESGRPRRLRQVGSAIVLMIVLLTGGVITATSVEAAPCRIDNCPEPRPEPPTPAPRTTHTTVNSLSPAYGWAGDVITVRGALLEGESVVLREHLGGQVPDHADFPAIIRSQNYSMISFVLPGIPVSVYGPPPVVTVELFGSHGNASSAFNLSAQLTLDLTRYFGGNNGHPDSSSYDDGKASINATIDRASGHVDFRSSIENDQFWLPLSLNVSVIWFGADGKAVGYTPARGISARGVAYRWPNPDPPILSQWSGTLQPNIGESALIGAGLIVVARDHAGDFSASLNDAIATAKTVAEVIKMMAAFA